jgi:hypothetical protein
MIETAEQKALREKQEMELFCQVELARLMDSAAPNIVEVTFDAKLTVAQHIAGFPGDDIEGDNALLLIGLVCRLTQLAREKKPETMPRHILTKAWGVAAIPATMKMYAQMDVLCSLFLTSKAKFGNYGCTTPTEMIKKISDIMDLWLPF